MKNYLKKTIICVANSLLIGSLILGCTSEYSYYNYKEKTKRIPGVEYSWYD